MIVVTVVVSMCMGDAPAYDATYFVPQLLGSQYTFITQIQNSLHSPHRGSLSLNPRGDHARSHTFGAYFGMPITSHLAATHIPAEGEQQGGEDDDIEAMEPAAQGVPVLPQLHPVQASSAHQMSEPRKV